MRLEIGRVGFYLYVIVIFIVAKCMDVFGSLVGLYFFSYYNIISPCLAWLI